MLYLFGLDSQWVDLEWGVVLVISANPCKEYKIVSTTGTDKYKKLIAKVKVMQFYNLTPTG